VRTKTDFSARIVAALAIGALAGLLSSCNRQTLPSESFDVTFNMPLGKGKPAPVPPDATLQPWSVWINQERPRQAKNPKWESYDAKTGATLELPKEGKWRCVLSPVHVFGRLDERGAVADWTASRRVRCSADAFQTFVETVVRALYEPDGSLTQVESPAAMSLEEVVQGQARFTAVVLRAGGPPKPSTQGVLKVP